METIHNISDLNPDQRDAVEKLIGQPLVRFKQIVIQFKGLSKAFVRFLGDERDGERQAPAEAAGWRIPACFNVLADLTDEERAEYDAALSQPVTLSRSDS